MQFDRYGLLVFGLVYLIAGHTPLFTGSPLAAAGMLLLALFSISKKGGGND